MNCHLDQHSVRTNVFFFSIVFLIVAVCAGVAAAEDKPLRAAAACRSPLAKYDPNRELVRGETVPEERGQPLRRYLYMMMKDSSACGTYDPHGVIVLDIDHGHAFVKRITSDLLENGPFSGNSGPGVRWATGNAVVDRLYYSYFGGVDRKLVGNRPLPPGANCVIGCIDLRTDTVIWEQPTVDACAAGISADGEGKAILAAVPHWSRNGLNKLTILDAMTGEVLEVKSGKGTEGGCHGVMIGRSGRLYPHNWQTGKYYVFDPKSNSVTRFQELIDRACPQAPKSFSDSLSCNGREDLFWTQMQSRSSLEAGFQMYDLGTGRTAFMTYQETLSANAAHPHSSKALSHTSGKRPVLSPCERWLYYNSGSEPWRATVFDCKEWPPRQVGIMGQGLSSKPQEDPCSGLPIPCGNKGGQCVSFDGSTLYTSDSWYFCTRTWKPIGLLRNDKGAIIRSVKMMEVHFRGKDVVYVADRESGFYLHPEKVFPPSSDKTPPTTIGNLKAAVGEPQCRWAGGEVVVEVKLTWSPATDNEGVQRYAVYRNGELLGNCLGVNPGIDPVMSEVDQAEYEKQVGKFEPNTFKARYVAPGKAYKFEVEPIDFAQNRGPRRTISVEVPAVSDEKRLALVKARIDEIAARATANKDKNFRGPCVTAILEILTTHRLVKAEAAPVLDRLASLAAGDDRDAKAVRAKIEANRKELGGGKQ